MIMKPYKILLSALLFAGVLTLAFFGCQKEAKKNPSVTSDASGGSGGSKVYAAPSLSLYAAGLQYIDITVTGTGPNWAPSGFTIQWMTAAANAQSGWPSSDVIDCSVGGAASFSGKAFASNYNLTSLNPSVTVRIGDLLLDNGASTICPNDLACSTAYVFRVFAHGDSKFNRSPWSPNFAASTLDCASGNCVLGGPGFWKNAWDPATANSWPGYDPSNPNASFLTLGGVSYTYVECYSILSSPDNGNDLRAVGRHEIAALLNIATGATGYDLTAADAYLALYTSATNRISPVGTASTAKGSSAGIVSTLNTAVHTCH
jgi:hypothetical protein